MPTAARKSAMPPNRLASSIGVRRLTSDSSTRCCIGFTAKNGSSGSIEVTTLADRTDDRGGLARGARHERHAAADVLRHRVVIRADRLLLGQPGRPDVADDADDREVLRLRAGAFVRSSGVVGLPHPAADRILSLPESLRQPLVDDQHLRRPLVVGRGEEPSALQRDATSPRSSPARSRSCRERSATRPAPWRSLRRG